MLQNEGSIVMKNLNRVLYKLILNWVFVESLNGANLHLYWNNRISGSIDCVLKKSGPSTSK